MKMSKLILSVCALGSLLGSGAHAAAQEQSFKGNTQEITRSPNQGAFVAPDDYTFSRQMTFNRSTANGSNPYVAITREGQNGELVVQRTYNPQTGQWYVSGVSNGSDMGYSNITPYQDKSFYYNTVAPAIEKQENRGNLQAPNYNIQYGIDPRAANGRSQYGYGYLGQ